MIPELGVTTADHFDHLTLNYFGVNEQIIWAADRKDRVRNNAFKARKQSLSIRLP